MEVCSVILPPDLWIEILLRLPLKCLARFKCVSKSWHSLISNPFFARSHFDLAIVPTHRLLLSSDLFCKIVSIDFNAPLHRDDATELKPPIPPQLSQPSEPQIIYSCRGLIFLHFGWNLCIWNPCTGIQRSLPSPPIYANPRSAFLRGFGYDFSTNDYLVTLCCRQRIGAEICVVIFSARANSWKQFDGIILETLNCRRSDVGGLFFNGAIHWIAYGHDKTLVDVIVAFDLTKRVFFEIALPDGFEIDDECELRVLGGLLGVCLNVWSGGFNDEIWVMEEYKVQSSWRCLARFSALDYKPYLFPICLTVEGNILGINHSFTELVKFNDKGEVLEWCDYNDSPYPNKCCCGSVVMHTHTLLSLPGDSLQAEDI